MQKDSVNIKLYPALFVTQIVFLVLKWTGTIDWHWAVILLPLMVIGISLILIFLLALLKALINSAKERDNKDTYPYTKYYK